MGNRDEEARPARGEPRRNRRGEATRARILSAATAALADRGLALTVDDVVRAAGTTRMTVYRHFGTREELITTVILAEARRLGDEVRPILESGEPFTRRLIGAIVHVVTAVRASPHLQAALARTNPAEDWPRIDPEERFIAVVWAFFRPYVEAAQHEVRLRADPDRTLDWLLRQVLLQLIVSGREGLGEDVLRREIETFVIPSIVAEETA